MRKSLPAFVAAMFLTPCVLAAGPTDYPSRPIRLIVPFAPGGPTDIIGRLVSARLAEAMRQQFIVDNRAGAGGNIGMGLAAAATPDGHTLILVSSSFVVNPGLYAKLPYDPHELCPDLEFGCDA